MIKVHGGWEDLKGVIHTQAEMNMTEKRLAEHQFAAYFKKSGYDRVMPRGAIWPVGDARSAYIKSTKII